MSADQSPERREDTFLVLLDIFMVVLILLNLGFLAFDGLYRLPMVQEQLAVLTPAFYTFYTDTIHANFFLIDLVFVAIFVMELLFQWARAVVNRRYRRWFYYPFVHWYDVLGCIPVASFRSLRILRAVAMVYRLQKLGLIDVTQTGPYQFVSYYLSVLVEELTDQVTLKILDNVEREVHRGGPVAERIVDEAIAPRRDVLAQWLSQRVHMVLAQTYHHYEEDVQHYVEDVIEEAVHNNQEIRGLEQIPVLGRQVSATLERAISDIVYRVMTRTIDDLTSAETNKVIATATSTTTAAVLQLNNEALHTAVREMLGESVDLIRQHVQIRRWKFENVRDVYTQRKAEQEAASAPVQP
jgi:hypothetical protein